MYRWAGRRGSSHKSPAILAVMSPRTIVAIGGFAEDSLVDYVLGYSRGKRILYVPTGGMENSDYTVWWYGLAAKHGATMSHLHFFPWPPEDLRERVLDHDVVLVPGGNTANMLAVWRVHGFDAVLREAWEAGGSSSRAGAPARSAGSRRASPTRSGRSSPRWTASASCPGVPARITTARSCAGLGMRSCFATACHPA